MERKIDYDRGVIIKTHERSGMDIFMYVDTPGVYLNAFGAEVADSLANEAGYDTARLSRERIKRERLAKAAASIEQELLVADREGQRTVVSEKEGFKVIDIGLGRHFVEDPDGNRLTVHALPIEQATALMKQLLPVKDKAATA